MPAISLDRVIALIPSAFTIAMLGAIESLLSAVVADSMAGTRHNSDQELIGQGIANVLSPLFGGFAATGAIARTATNFRNGATSPLAGIAHALTLLLTLLLLAPLAAQIPLAALAAILFFVAWTMSDVPSFLRMARTAPPSDVAVLLITFTLTVFTDLVIAVNIGVILAMLLFMRRMASSVELIRLEGDPLQAELSALGRSSAPPAALIYAIDGPLFFGAVESLERVLQQSGPDPDCIIIRLGRVPFMDITGLQSLDEAIRNLEHRGVHVLLCEAKARVLRKLARTGIVRRDAVPIRYFRDLGLALDEAEGRLATPPLEPVNHDRA